MSIRAHQWTIAILLGVALLLGWRCFILYRQMVKAAFIGSQCEITQKMFIDPVEADPKALAFRLEFLSAYFNGHSQALVGSPLESIVRRDYERTLTNAVAAFRRWTTSDLGDDPRVWIQKYGH